VETLTDRSNKMRTEDGYVIHKCLNGDKAAFGLLVDKYKASIYALAYSKLRSFEDAEDVTQEVFIKAYLKLRTLRWWDNFLAWLYAITSNLCTDWIRSKSKRPDREFVADQEPDVLNRPSMNSYREGLVRESLKDALESLPDTYRQALTLYYLGGMSTKEIARFLGVSPNNVAQRLRRARAKLKEEMITMMDETYEQQRLRADFTFRIVEMVKRLKIQSVPRMPWLPWGLSVAAGIMLAILSSVSPLIPLNHVYVGLTARDRGLVDSLGKALSAHSDQAGEMPVYSDVPVTLELAEGDNSDSPLTAGASDASTAGKGSEPLPGAGQMSMASPAAKPEAEEKITISGRILKDDVPVPDAQVYIYDHDTGIKHEGTAQADSSFQIEIAKSGDKWPRLTAVAQHPLHSFGWANISEGNTENVAIRLRQPVPITGTITDERGNPIQGANVQLRAVALPAPRVGPPSGDRLSGGAIPIPSVVRTENDGLFAFRDLPEGSVVDLDIIAPGYAKERKFNISAGTEGLMVKLKRAGSIEGRVVFGETGEPVKGVEVYTQGVYPSEGWGDSQTDENGYYSLTNLPAGEYDVMLGGEHTDWTAVAREYVKVSEGQAVKNMNLELVKGGFIAGKVTYKDSGEPIPGHGISFYDASRPESQASIRSATTDENGFYRFRAAPGKAKVYTWAPAGYQFGFAEKYVEVREGETLSDVDFQFQRAVLLSVNGKTLSSDGKPVPGAIVSDRGDPSTEYGVSDKDGRFTIPGLISGQRLSVTAEQRELQLRGYANVEVQPDSEVEIVLQKYETISVSGRVISEAGVPIPSAGVGLMRWDREIQGGIGTSAGMTDSAGEYTISGLIVGDEYKVSASAGGYRDGGTEMFTATVDMSRLEDIVLLPPGDFFLQGMVMDTDGKAVAGAEVTAGSSRMKTDEDGYYRLGSLPVMVEVSMGVYHQDYGHNSFAYVPTNGTHDFVIAKAERYLAGKVVDADGDPVANVAVFPEPQLDAASGHIDPAASTNLLGEFRLENILHERVSVGLSSNELRFSKSFDDVETNREDVVFVFDKSLEPPEEPPTEEQKARWKYRETIANRLEELKGKPAPELDVSEWLYGEPVRLAELKGKVVVLYFWSRGDQLNLFDRIEAIRLLNVLQREYGERGLVCIGIHESRANADEQRVRMAERGIAFPAALDRESPVAGAKGVTFDRYGEPSGPIVIDRAGMVHGDVWDHELEKTIRELLSD
jgi:RNA polymerase sigma factor (sigma-70 family)